jgi:hypothetical protein
MATDMIKAADDARRILKGFKAFAEVADALEAAGQIELRAAEAQRVLADLQPRIEAGQAAVLEAQARAAQMAAAAHADANRIVSAAELQASETVAAARQAAAKLTEDADAVVVKRKAEGVRAMGERDSAMVKRDALVKECTALEQRLADAKAQVAKLLG